jgi:hypothetical protein
VAAPARVTRTAIWRGTAPWYGIQPGRERVLCRYRKKINQSFAKLIKITHVSKKLYIVYFLLLGKNSIEEITQGCYGM